LSRLRDFFSGREAAREKPRAMAVRRVIFATALGIALAADLATKWAAFRFVGLGREVQVIGDFFSLRPALNEGVIFGLSVPIAVPAAVSVIASGVAAWYLCTFRGRAPVVQVYLGLVLSGVLGNLIDRLLVGAVRDFMDLYVSGYHWPTFNLADAFLVAGVALAMAHFVLAEEKKTEPAMQEHQT
jgi:signal peptidase II